MNHTSRSVPSLLVVLALAVSAVLIPGAAVAGDPPAAAAESLAVTRAMTLPEFLGEVEKRAPGLFRWPAGERAIESATLPLGTYPLDHDGLVRVLRGHLFSQELLVVPSQGAKPEPYWVLDLRATPKPEWPALVPQTVTLDGANLADLGREEGLLVAARIPAKGLAHLDAVVRVLRVVLTPENVGSVTVAPDAQAFDVVDFAPNVVKAHRLVQELAALPALAR